MNRIRVAQARGCTRLQAEECPLSVSGRWMNRWCIGAVLAFAGLWASVGPARSQAPEVEYERPGPPKLDDMETDANTDGLPDGWYNARDAKLVATGGQVGP